MNNIDLELFESTMKMVKDCLEVGEDKYQEIKTTLLIRGSDSENVRNYLQAVFDYIDKRRTKLIEMSV